MIHTVENRFEIATEFDREEFFRSLYLKMFPAVANFIRKQNGTLDDAKDVFHDALIIFYEKKVDAALEIQLTDEAYVFGIVKHLWIKKTKEAQRVLLSETESLISLPEDFESHSHADSIVTFLKSAGQKCMSLLEAFYYEKKSLDLITSAFGFSSIRSATVQKYKCLEKVRDLVKRKSKNYEDFTN
jgi:DNA-directed RNA polymerase specialized sigma24 family protein